MGLCPSVDLMVSPHSIDMKHPLHRQRLSAQLGHLGRVLLTCSSQQGVGFSPETLCSATGPCPLGLLPLGTGPMAPGLQPRELCVVMPRPRGPCPQSRAARMMVSSRTPALPSYEVIPTDQGASRGHSCLVTVCPACRRLSRGWGQGQLSLLPLSCSSTCTSSPPGSTLTRPPALLGEQSSPEHPTAGCGWWKEGQ